MTLGASVCKIKKQLLPRVTVKKTLLSSRNIQTTLLIENKCHCFSDDYVLADRADEFKHLSVYNDEKKKRPEFIANILWIYIYLNNFFTTWRIRHKVNFLIFRRSCRWFEFWIFLLYQGYRTQAALLFTHKWEQKRWIDSFLKSIGSKLNVNSWSITVYKHRNYKFGMNESFVRSKNLSTFDCLQKFSRMVKFVFIKIKLG